jgi:hypothetical protein
MKWSVLFDENFAEEFSQLDANVQIEIEALTFLLQEFGPKLARPHADTLKG